VLVIYGSRLSACSCFDLVTGCNRGMRQHYQWAVLPHRGLHTCACKIMACCSVLWGWHCRMAPVSVNCEIVAKQQLQHSTSAVYSAQLPCRSQPTACLSARLQHTVHAPEHKGQWPSLPQRR
jgi:hypothetical protein